MRLLRLNGVICGTIALVGGNSAFLNAQGTLEDYRRAERSLPWNVRQLVAEADVKPHWISDTGQFWYLKEANGSKEFLRVDPGSGSATPAFDHAKLSAAINQAARRADKSNALPFKEFTFADGDTAIEFSLDKRQWKCSLKNYECAAKTDVPADPQTTLAPDGKRAAFVREHNIYLRDLRTGQEVQLTSDGEKSWDYATPLASLQPMVEQGTEDVRQRADVYWSPDSTKLITYRLDSRQAGRFTSLQFVPPDQLRPKTYSYVYPLPGEIMPRAAPVIFDARSGKRIDVQTEPLEIYFQGGLDFEWYKDSRRIHYIFRSRGDKRAEYREADAETGKERVVVQEERNTYIDPGENAATAVNQGAELLWLSERDGWNHIYLYNGVSGQLENQVTKGSWVVRSIERADEKERVIHFLASGREPDEDPYLTHLYRINFDGSGLQLLTPEPANHAVSISPGGAWFVDNYSRVDLPTQSALRRITDGSVARVLQKTDATALLKTGWKFPEPFKGMAADGQTAIYGLIWRPSNFDPSKKYPVIEQVYTGPQAFFVPKTFAAYRAPEQAVAELGFIVVMVDGRGTTGRSRAFHEYSYRNLGGAFDDHVALIRQMGAKYPYMDLTRVGIYGTSAGGYGAAHAMLVHPEFYKVGVTISGDHDARLDKAWWNELYQGYPVEGDYAAQSNITLAPKLEGHLLLVHGDVDHNVHPVETLRFADALMKANKDFDMLFVPNMFHGEGANVYLIRRRWDYFVRHLLGVEPPKDFKITRREPDDKPE